MLRVAGKLGATDELLCFIGSLDLGASHDATCERAKDLVIDHIGGLDIWRHDRTGSDRPKSG